MDQKIKKKTKKGKEEKRGRKEKQQPSDVAIYVLAALFLAFILLFYMTLPPSDFEEETTITVPKNMSPLEEFMFTLSESDELAIVENITGAAGKQSQYVFVCGAGLAGSWGRLGRNLSTLHMYIIENENCIYSNPILVNETGELFVTRTVPECIAEYENMPYFYIQYGPSFSVFTNSTAHIHIDETFEYECSFGEQIEREVE